MQTCDPISARWKRAGAMRSRSIGMTYRRCISDKRLGGPSEDVASQRQSRSPPFPAQYPYSIGTRYLRVRGTLVPFDDTRLPSGARYNVVLPIRPRRTLAID